MWGNGWLVRPAIAQSLEPRLQRPIISIMQGVDVLYDSIESLVTAVIDWVCHSKYDGYTLSNEIELENWQHHNPGIFQR